MFDWFHNKVPYTDFQQKNLDWLTETVREGEAAVEAKIEEADDVLADVQSDTATAISNAEAATTAANNAKDAANTAAASANAAATAANNAKTAADTAAANAQAAADKWATPYASTTVAGMTDHAKIYVYTGTEVGYTAGNWYYWNGSAWTSGGVYVGDVTDAVLFSGPQTKTDSEKLQAQINIGAEDLLNNFGYSANVKGIVAENILGSHGNFEDFALVSGNWYKAYSESTATVSSNVCTFTANRQYGSLRHQVSTVGGHTYYISAFVSTLANLCSISLNLGNVAAIPNDGNTHFVSSLSYPATNANGYFALTNSSATDNTLPIYIQKVCVIDLTETYGSGNEPTKEEMDKAIAGAGYFIDEGFLFYPDMGKQKPYTGKKILFMGDSITAANLNSNGWCKYFNEIMLPAKSVNVAVSGATWRDKPDTVLDGNPSTYVDANNTIANQVEKIARGKDTDNPNYNYVADYADFDIIIIAAGTNDGPSYFDTDDLKDSLQDNYGIPVAYANIDRTNSVGAMVYAYERLYTMYPNAKYYYCTPIQAYPAKKTWQGIQHIGSVMKTTGDYIPPIIIDTEKCGIFGNQEQYDSNGTNLADGLHPNAAGAEKMGVYNANAIIKDYLSEM